MNKYFKENYEESLEQFLSLQNKLKTKWKNCSLKDYSKNENDNLGMRIFVCEAEQSDKVIVLSSGLHGIEGFVGSAMITLFIDKYLSAINSENTSLILIHGINAWGMKNFRKVNENNIDLNRNFITDWTKKEVLINNEYLVASKLLDIKQYSNRQFYQNFIKIVLKLKPKGLTKAVTLGQYDNQNGIYFGGYENVEIVSILIEFYKDLLGKYENITFLDLHTGYGPANQMYLVNSKYEKNSEEYWKKRFNFPFIQCNNGASFYHINGDMVDCLYELHRVGEFTSNLYATTFEFGTIGESLLAQTESLKITIEDNYLAIKQKQLNNKRRIDRMKKLYYPSSKKWRKKAIRDAEQVFQQILMSI